MTGAAGMPQHRIPNPSAGVWAQPRNGLSGRLRVEFEDLDPGLRHAIYLELRNHSLNSITVTDRPRIHAELFGSSGRSIASSGITGDGPMPAHQWAVIPQDVYVGFRVDMRNVGAPAREHRMVQVAVGGENWELTEGEYMLKASAVFERGQSAPRNQWIGDLDLPPIKIVVTRQMFATK
jgi:hypothetical protein